MIHAWLEEHRQQGAIALLVAASLLFAVSCDAQNVIRDEDDQVLERAISEVAKRLPSRLNSQCVWRSVMVTGHREVTFDYEVDMSPAEFDLDATRRNVKNSSRTDPLVADLKRDGVSALYVYRQPNGTYLGEVKIASDGRSQ